MSYDPCNNNTVGNEIRKEMDLLSDRMLANTVIEDWSYELEETEETGIGDISNDNAGTSKHSIFDA